MGATLWYHAAPWFPNAEDALFALQSQFLAEHYDFTELKGGLEPFRSRNGSRPLHPPLVDQALRKRRLA